MHGTSIVGDNTKEYELDHIFFSIRNPVLKCEEFVQWSAIVYPFVHYWYQEEYDPTSTRFIWSLLGFIKNGSF